MKFLDQSHCFNAVGALAYDFHVPDRVEQVLQLFAGQLFVVDDERRIDMQNFDCRKGIRQGQWRAGVTAELRA